MTDTKNEEDEVLWGEPPEPSEQQSDIGKAELNLRESVIDRIMPLFKLMNFIIIGVVVVASIVDYIFIGTKLIAPGERLITSNVMMSLIGATVVQLGLGMSSIYAYLFPKIS